MRGILQHPDASQPPMPHRINCPCMANMRNTWHATHKVCNCAARLADPPFSSFLPPSAEVRLHWQLRHPAELAVSPLPQRHRQPLEAPCSRQDRVLPVNLAPVLGQFRCRSNQRGGGTAAQPVIRMQGTANNFYMYLKCCAGAILPRKLEFASASQTSP